MSGVLGAVAWAETAAALYERYQAAADVASRKRLQVLWLVRSGERVRAAVRQAGVGERTVVRWLGWYREGGLGAVLARTPGHGALGAPARLSEEQQWLLAEASARGAFRTYDEARDWVRERYGVAYRYKGVYTLLRRLGVRPKAPRPVAEQADLAAQEARKKGGLAGTLARAGVQRGDDVACADELRLGLRDQVRRVLAPRGVRVRQRVQLRYAWVYLLLAVHPRSGRLRWAWLERMGQVHLRPVLEAWGLDALVRDGAGAHRGKTLADLRTKRVLLPPYSPELNPAERVFEEVRRRAEGRVYETLQAKRDAVERYLAALAADPERVRSLCGWTWLQDAQIQLPQPSTAR